MPILSEVAAPLHFTSEAKRNLIAPLPSVIIVSLLDSCW